MSGDTRMVVAAVGFDLGETLYHYGDAPMRWPRAKSRGILWPAAHDWEGTSGRPA